VADVALDPRQIARLESAIQVLDRAAVADADRLKCTG
jgi:hypothetical protein